MDVVLALAVGLGGLYGVLTAAAGAAQLRSNEIPPWDAILTVLGGLFVLAWHC